MEDFIEVNPVYKVNYLFANLTVSKDLLKRIKVAQNIDEELQGFLTSLNFLKNGEDEVLRYEGRLCVPKNEALESKIQHDAYHSKHLGTTKM